jgi:outer membrane protein assembly factor BamB
VGGRVFVTVVNLQSGQSRLFALSARTGRAEWSVRGFISLAYDGRRIFAVGGGLLAAFVASTGRELWALQLPANVGFASPPVAYDGVVYVAGGASVGGAIAAVSEADAAVRWGAGVLNGDSSSPAVDNSGAYVSYACQQDYRFSLGGHLAWHRNPFCDGGGGSTPVLHGGFVYARGFLDTPLILSQASGAQAGTFSSATVPAFAGTSMFTLQNGRLIAVGQSGSPQEWTFGNGSLVTAPVINGGVVFVGSGNGVVYGVSASSGKRVWKGIAGLEIFPPVDGGVSAGMAVAGGMLVVPAGPVLTAFSVPAR